jgi:hypothetical protein
MLGLPEEEVILLACRYPHYLSFLSFLTLSKALFNAFLMNILVVFLLLKEIKR